jgi:hypothetical protein
VPIIQLLLLIDAFLHPPARVFYLLFSFFYRSLFSKSLHIHRGYQIHGNSPHCTISLITWLERKLQAMSVLQECGDPDRGGLGFFSFSAFL